MPNTSMPRATQRPMTRSTTDAERAAYRQELAEWAAETAEIRARIEAADNERRAADDVAYDNAGWRGYR
jgi:secreted protein with Ig-like and vWFA domain